MRRNIVRFYVLGTTNEWKVCKEDFWLGVMILARPGLAMLDIQVEIAPSGLAPILPPQEAGGAGSSRARHSGATRGSTGVRG